MRGVCAIAGCGRPLDSFGMCNVHYHRWRRGSLDSPNVALRDRQRHLTSVGVLPEFAYFGARIANVGSCWQWTGGTNGVDVRAVRRADPCRDGPRPARRHESERHAREEMQPCR